MKDERRAEELGRSLVRVGKRAGLRVVALLTNMDMPIGRAIGNALETREAIEVLRGEGPADTRELTLALGAEMLVLGRVTKYASTRAEASSARWPTEVRWSASGAWSWRTEATREWSMTSPDCPGPRSGSKYERAAAAWWPTSTRSSSVCAPCAWAPAGSSPSRQSTSGRHRTAGGRRGTRDPGTAPGRAPRRQGKPVRSGAHARCGGHPHRPAGAPCAPPAPAKNHGLNRRRDRLLDGRRAQS